MRSTGLPVFVLLRTSLQLVELQSHGVAANFFVNFFFPFYCVTNAWTLPPYRKAALYVHTCDFQKTLIIILQLGVEKFTVLHRQCGFVMRHSAPLCCTCCHYWFISENYIYKVAHMHLQVIDKVTRSGDACMLVELVDIQCPTGRPSFT